MIFNLKKCTLKLAGYKCNKIVENLRKTHVGLKNSWLNQRFDKEEEKQLVKLDEEIERYLEDLRNYMQFYELARKERGKESEYAKRMITKIGTVLFFLNHAIAQKEIIIRKDYRRLELLKECAYNIQKENGIKIDFEQMIKWKKDLV